MNCSVHWILFPVKATFIGRPSSSVSSLKCLGTGVCTSHIIISVSTSKQYWMKAYAMVPCCIEKSYLQYQHNPPVSKNQPPVAGAIAWERSLFLRIKHTIIRFQAVEDMMTSDYGKAVSTLEVWALLQTSESSYCKSGHIIRSNLIQERLCRLFKNWWMLSSYLFHCDSIFLVFMFAGCVKWET